MTFTTLVNFDGTNGAGPYAGLFADAAGDLFGTTANGGAQSLGTVFEIAKTASGYSTPIVLASFNGTDGATPYAGLIADAAGNLFGTTGSGGAYNYGVVFEITKTASGYASTPTVLVSFDGPDGATPYAGLIADAAGNLFGTTHSGGASYSGAPYYGYGTVFEIAKTPSGYAGTPTVLDNFSFVDGGNLFAGLTADAAGNLFGTTWDGAFVPPGYYNNAGSVFELANTSSGYTRTILAGFSGALGSNLYAGLITDAAGDLFGTAAYSGAYGYGTVFEIAKTASGYSTPIVLASFDGSHGANPLAGLIGDAAGNLFGTTEYGGSYGYGTVFEIAKTASGYVSTPIVLHNFDGSDGAYPNAGLIADAAGNLFGTTYGGGLNNGGTVFEITNSGFLVALPPTVVADRTGVNVGASITVDATHGVLANDSDPIAGDTLHVSAVNGQLANVGQAIAGTFGTLTLNADGSYTYSAPSSDVLPASGVDEDVFTYAASTGQGGTADSTLTVVVTAAGLTYVPAPVGGSATQPNGGHYAILDGTAGNAILNAANGVGAALVGGNGDTLNGANSGKDTFVFMGDFGTNTVNNYIGKANGNFDVIQLSKSDFGTNPAALANYATQAPGSANTVITDPVNHDTITLVGVSLSSLHFDASHFLLV